MKKLVIACSLMLASVITYAQNDKYVKGMEKNLQMLDSAKTPEQFTEVAAAFERIGDAEKTQWLPYYYASFANILKGFRDQKADKDAVADKAEAMIAKAEAIEPKNSEMYVLKNMASTLHLLVDPQTRYMQYLEKMSGALAAAKQIDPNNPRIYLMEGQGVFGTPEQFGGGKDKARPILEKSVALFQSQKPASSIHPHWGKEQAEQMLALCK